MRARTLALIMLTLAACPSAASAQARVDPVLAGALQAGPASERIDLIVHARSWRAADRAARRAGLRVRAIWERIDAVWASGTPAQIRRARAGREATYLEADVPYHPQLDTSLAATRAHEAFTRLKSPDGLRLDGAGVTIAIIDTGTDGNHPFFREDDGTSAVVRNLKSVCFPDSYADACWVDTGPANDSDSPSTSGHGTHVTGIAAGRPVTTLSGKDLHGMAPGAKVVSISGGQAVSAALTYSATEWILDNHARPCGEAVSPQACPPIRVVNHSHGPSGGGEFSEESTWVKLQRELLAAGIVSVWSAGNSGGDGSEVRTNPSGQDPAPGILMVANYDDDQSGTRSGEVANSSSRGDSERPETFPDVSAPGTDILSSCRPWLPICYWLEPEDGPAVTDVHTFNAISGTSMAAPHVTGIVALLFQAEPSATPAQVERAIVMSAHRYEHGAPYVPDPRGGLTSVDKGHGLVDAVAAVEMLREMIRGKAGPAPGGPGPGAPPASRPGAPATGTQAPGSGKPREKTSQSRRCRSARSRLKAARRATARARRAAARARGSAARRRAARVLKARRRAEGRARAQVKARC